MNHLGRALGALALTILVLAGTVPVGLAAQAGTTPGATRAYEHAFGVTDIPSAPKRVVVAQHAFLEAFLELGVPVVGAAQDASPAAGLEAGFSLSDPARYDLSGIASIGTADQPNLETISALDPDLIFVAGDEYYRPLYDQLSRIAPAAAPPVFAAPSARAAVAMIADLTETTDRLATLDADYEDNVAGLRDRVAGFGGELTVSAIQFTGTDQFRVSDEAGGYPYVEVMADAGIPRPVAQVGIAATLDLSIEALPEHDADLLAVVCYGDITDASCADLFDLPIYRALNVGRLGQGRVLAANEWPSTSYASLNAIVDQFEDVLSTDLDVSADVESAVPAAAEGSSTAQPATPEATGTRSVVDARGETIFVLEYGEEGGDRTIQALASHPLWSRLPAVRAGQVFPLDGFAAAETPAAAGVSAAGYEYTIAAVADALASRGQEGARS